MIIKLILKVKKLIRATFYNNVQISKKATVSNTQTEEYVHLANYCNVSNCKIGSYTSIGRFSNVFNTKIGRFCSISWNVTIGATQHPLRNLTTHAFPYVTMFDFTDRDNKIVQYTNIGNDVWIGTNAVIMPGVVINNGAVIGANAVVTKDVEAYGIYVGVPAKKINSRFSPELIKVLQKLEWWDWSREVIEKKLHLFKGNITEEILDQLMDDQDIQKIITHK